MLYQNRETTPKYTIPQVCNLAQVWKCGGTYENMETSLSRVKAPWTKGFSMDDLQFRKI